MEYLGVKYSAWQKTIFLMDINVKYRKEYIQRYLKNEYRCFYWVQMPIEEVEELEKMMYFSKRRLDTDM